jgi:hypothetical protein
MSLALLVEAGNQYEPRGARGAYQEIRRILRNTGLLNL